MKAAPFAYRSVSSVTEALDALAADPEAKVLAGGQSLVPMLAMRLARPTALIDVNHVDELTGLRRDGAWVQVGALVRQRDLERSAEVAAIPAAAMALPYVGHRELRNRGTVGGSLAHADPAAELPAVAVTLGAVLVARGAGGQREIPARDFFTGPLQTALRPGELLTAVRFPAARPGDSFAFEEVARRHGDFAICGVMAAVHRENHQVTSATVGLFGVGDRPVAVNVTEAVTAGTDAADIGRQVADGLSPSGDFHASASYRRRLAAALTGRCLDRALTEKTLTEKKSP